MKGLTEWLSENVGSHEIYDSAALAARFEADTGLKATWPTHSEAETVRDIKVRGKGGALVLGSPASAYGFEIAEHFAQELAGFTPWQRGLGFRFNSALEALKAKGL